MNFNFHQSLEDKCHRMLNAVEPGKVVPIDLWSTLDATRHSLFDRVEDNVIELDNVLIEYNVRAPLAVLR